MTVILTLFPIRRRQDINLEKIMPHHSFCSEPLLEKFWFLDLNTNMKTLFKNSIICVLLLSVALFFSTASAEPADISAVVTSIQKSYEKIKDFKASFTQEITLKTLKKTNREEGTVYFKNPKRMLWVYTKPKEKKLIINPKQAWLYVPEDKVAYVQSSDAIFNSRIVIRFLAGLGKITDDFQARFFQPAARDSSGNYLIVLSPKGEDIGVGDLYLTVDKDSYLILKCRFADDYGNITQISFRNIELNKNISDGIFNFKPPEGVEVMKTP